MSWVSDLDDRVAALERRIAAVEDPVQDGGQANVVLTELVTYDVLLGGRVLGLPYDFKPQTESGRQLLAAPWRLLPGQPLMADFILAIEAEAHELAGHRTDGPHDCFLMNCKRLGPEVTMWRNLYAQTAVKWTAVADAAGLDDAATPEDVIRALREGL